MLNVEVIKINVEIVIGNFYPILNLQMCKDIFNFFNKFFIKTKKNIKNISNEEKLLLYFFNYRYVYNQL